MWPYSFARSGYSRTSCWRLPLASGTNEDRVLTQMSSLRASATNTIQGELLTSYTYPIHLLQLPRTVHCVVGPWALCSFCTRDTSSSVAAGIRIPGWMRCSEEVTSICARVPQRTTRSGGSCTSKMSLIFKPLAIHVLPLIGTQEIYLCVFEGTLFASARNMSILHCPALSCSNCALSTLALCVYYAVLRSDPDLFPHVSQCPRPSPFFCNCILVTSLCFQINFCTTRALVFSSGFYHSTVFDCSASKLSFIIIIIVCTFWELASSIELIALMTATAAR